MIGFYLVITVCLYFMLVLPCLASGSFDMPVVFVPVIPVILWPLILFLAAISVAVFFLLVLPDLFDGKSGQAGTT